MWTRNTDSNVPLFRDILRGVRHVEENFQGFDPADYNMQVGSFILNVRGRTARTTSRFQRENLWAPLTGTWNSQSTYIPSWDAVKTKQVRASY